MGLLNLQLDIQKPNYAEMEMCYYFILVELTVLALIFRAYCWPRFRPIWDDFPRLLSCDNSQYFWAI
jgi:hypothetical protein